jgi:hypothetical protein
MSQSTVTRALIVAALTTATTSLFSGPYVTPKTGFPKKASFAQPGPTEELFENQGKQQVALKTPSTELTLGAVVKFESNFAKNLTLLNSNLPDETGFYKQTIDFTGDLVLGEEEFGHKALEFFADIRHKSVWGNVGLNTKSETVKLGDIDVVTGSHSHSSKQPLIWLKDGWMQMSLNAIVGVKDKTIQYFKVGFFPFLLGRGIALGPIYGIGKDFLGLYTGYQNDVSPPGITLHGDIFEDRLRYDLYYAKLEEKSASFADTMEHVKSNHVGRMLNPWRGANKDNDLLAARLQWTAIKSGKGKLELEPYIMYNIASDRKIEFEADAKSELGTAGLSLEYGCPNGTFEFGAEAAFNFGHESVYNIDRNVVKLVRDASGNIITQYSHVVDTADSTVTKVTVTSTRKTTLQNNTSVTNGEAFSNDAALFNASNRYRPAFRVDYAGYMAVVDTSYMVNAIDTKFALAYGVASGDSNPHDQETSSNYNGFIGLQEAYAGKRVPSILVLDARKLKRPLTLDNNTRDALDDASFTDMHYLGGGVTWSPINGGEKKFFVRTNVLGYWKFLESFAYDLANTQVSTTDKASKYLGTELNFQAKYEMLDNLYIFGDFAIFFPGGYYNDIQGTPLQGDVFTSLDLADATGVDSSNYRIANDTAYLLNFGLTYRF